MLPNPRALLSHSIWNMKIPLGMRVRVQTLENVLMSTNGLDDSMTSWGKPQFLVRSCPVLFLFFSSHPIFFETLTGYARGLITSIQFLPQAEHWSALRLELPIIWSKWDMDTWLTLILLHGARCWVGPRGVSKGSKWKVGRDKTVKIAPKRRKCIFSTTMYTLKHMENQIMSRLGEEGNKWERRRSLIKNEESLFSPPSSSPSLPSPCVSSLTFQGVFRRPT